MASGGILNWDWYMNSRRAQFLSSLMTRTGARIFYAAIGIGLVVFGALLAGGMIEMKR